MDFAHKRLVGPVFSEWTDTGILPGGMALSGLANTFAAFLVCPSLREQIRVAGAVTLYEASWEKMFLAILAVIIAIDASF